MTLEEAEARIDVLDLEVQSLKVSAELSAQIAERFQTSLELLKKLIEGHDHGVLGVFRR